MVSLTSESSQSLTRRIRESMYGAGDARESVEEEDVGESVEGDDVRESVEGDDVGEDVGESVGGDESVKEDTIPTAE